MGRTLVLSFILVSMMFLPGLKCVDVVEEVPHGDNTIPAGVSEFLSDAQISELESAGLKIFTGSNPPNIVGEYSLNELAIFYDDKDINFVIADYFYTFSNQTGDGKIRISYRAPAANDSASNIPAFVSGTGNCFSAYVDIKGNDGGCNYTQTSIISGCVKENGIEKWQNGFIWGPKSGDNCGELINEGHRRIIHENDKLAEKVQ